MTMVENLLAAENNNNTPRRVIPPPYSSDRQSDSQPQRQLPDQSFVTSQTPLLVEPNNDHTFASSFLSGFFRSSKDMASSSKRSSPQHYQSVQPEEGEEYAPFRTPKSSEDDEDDARTSRTTNDDTVMDHLSSRGDDTDHSDDDDNDLESSGSLSQGLQRLILVAAATAATLGYDVGIMAAAIQPLTTEMQLTDVQKEVAMGSLNFIAAAGALVGGKIANDKGRKITVRVCCYIFVIGTLCMAISPNFAVLLLGRIVTGIGVGISFVVAPIYLSETAPTEQRGFLNTIFDVAINGGILLGYVLGFVIQLLPHVSESIKWRLMLGMGLIMPLIVLWNLNYLPESPRWLVMVDQSLAAKQVLEHTLGQSPRQVIRTVSSIEEELQYERRQSERNASAVVELTERRSAFCTYWKSWTSDIANFKWTKGMRLAVALGFWQQITGTEAVLYYSADFLEHAGLTSITQRLLGNVFVGLCKLTPELVAMNIVDKVGRRPLLLASAISLTLSTATLSLAFYMSWAPLLVVILLCTVMASFSIGLGPFSFLVASENLGLSERATGMMVCAAANRCTSGSVALTAVSLYRSLGSSGLFALYAFVGFLSLPFYFMTVPETSGQSLEELAARNREEEEESESEDPEISVTETPPSSKAPSRGDSSGIELNNGEYA